MQCNLILFKIFIRSSKNMRFWHLNDIYMRKCNFQIRWFTFIIFNILFDKNKIINLITSWKAQCSAHGIIYSVEFHISSTCGSCCSCLLDMSGLRIEMYQWTNCVVVLVVPCSLLFHANIRTPLLFYCTSWLACHPRKVSPYNVRIWCCKQTNKPSSNQQCN